MENYTYCVTLVFSFIVVSLCVNLFLTLINAVINSIAILDSTPMEAHFSKSYTVIKNNSASSKAAPLTKESQQTFYTSSKIFFVLKRDGLKIGNSIFLVLKVIQNRLAEIQSSSMQSKIYTHSFLNCLILKSIFYSPIYKNYNFIHEKNGIVVFLRVFQNNLDSMKRIYSQTIIKIYPRNYVNV